MADPTTFAELWDQFLEEWDTFSDEYWGSVQRIADMINNELSSVAQFFDDVLPGANEAEHAVEKWNNEIFPALEKGFLEIVDKVGEAVNDLYGVPLDLQLYAETFVQAKSDLYRQRGYAEAARGVSDSWTGPAFDKYDVVSGEQYEALKQLADALDEGGKLTSAAANKILQLWADLINEFATFYADILDILASATDVSKVLSFEVPTILEACATVWRKVAAIAKILLDFMVAQATTDTVAWLSLAAGSGSLPNNEWPPISETASDTINDPENWDAA